ncbi:MAG: hypothetical protein ACLR7U_05900 [Ruthenibacterium lactatiformans]
MKVLGGGVPREVLPTEVRQIFCAGGHEMLLANSAMRAALKLKTPTGRSERHCQRYDLNGVITGEGAMTKDLIEVADVDFPGVSIASIAAVFLIIAISFAQRHSGASGGRHRKCHYDQYGHPILPARRRPLWQHRHRHHPARQRWTTPS